MAAGFNREANLPSCSQFTTIATAVQKTDAYSFGKRSGCNEAIFPPVRGPQTSAKGQATFFDICKCSAFVDIGAARHTGHMAAESSSASRQYPEHIPPHSGMDDAQCCGMFFGVERGDAADLKRNECGFVLNTVRVARHARMEMTIRYLHMGNTRTRQAVGRAQFR